MNKFKNFKNLHQQENPLLLGNVWNAQSALLFQKSGYKAVGTSSAAIATSLGYEDGEKMPFATLLRIVKSIQSKISIPLTVDIEGGYCTNNSELINNVIELHKLGVVGVNIEDSLTNATRNIIDITTFSETIQQLKKCLLEKNISIFINVRTDFYILGLDNPLKETLKRINIYEKNGADGLFIPCVVNEDDIQQIVKASSLPINVMCMPNLSDFKKLQQLGVKRISFGPFLYNNIIEKLENTIKEVLIKQSYNPLFK